MATPAVRGSPRAAAIDQRTMSGTAHRDHLAKKGGEVIAGLQRDLGYEPGTRKQGTASPSHSLEPICPARRSGSAGAARVGPGGPTPRPVGVPVGCPRTGSPRVSVPASLKRGRSMPPGSKGPESRLAGI